MPNDRDEQFTSKLQKGTLFHWKDYRFDENTTKDKFLLILSKNPRSSIVIGVLPTSKVEDYKPSGKYGKRDLYRIEKGKSKYFSKSTVLDFTSYQMIQRDDIKKAYFGGEAKILGPIEDEILEKIDEVVKNAYTLSDKEKERII